MSAGTTGSQEKLFEMIVAEICIFYVYLADYANLDLALFFALYRGESVDYQTVNLVELPVSLAPE